MKSKSKKIAAYVRVSTTGQNEAGQVAAIKRWIEGHNVGNVEWFVDKATGTNLDRPEFRRLQAAIFHGEVDTVLVFKLDRLARSLRDGINVLCEWLDNSVRLVSVTQELDFSGASGKLIASTLFAVAEMENEVRRERQAEGIAVAKAEGVYKGRQTGAVTHKAERIRELLGRGLTHAEVAKALGCSTKTVQRAVSS